MRITSIQSKNYRTLDSTTIPFSPHYCTISGRNNAGKSSVIRLLSALLRRRGYTPWGDDGRFDYKEDKTQWTKQGSPIEVSYYLHLSKTDDPALISFIEKMITAPLPDPTLELTITYHLSDADAAPKISVHTNGKGTDDKTAKDIAQRIRESNLLSIYNSTTKQEEFYYGRGRRRLYDIGMSEEDKRSLIEASKNMERSIRRLAKDHRNRLNTVLGRLADRYAIELSPLEGYTNTQMPLGISLTDKLVNVPLNDWGSGTQNRTHILLAILQANRIKTSESADDRITPIVVLEEPESFLHPSAQAEFGRLLRALAVEFGIQIIVTTHSPHMLNREEPTSNILLCRNIRRGKTQETAIVNTSGESWMAPFAEHLGIPSEEFKSLRSVFTGYKSKVLLVEGPIDRDYFSYLQSGQLQCEALSSDIEIVPYGGKDVLRNTLLVQFVLSKFDHVFITYDVDAESEVGAALARLGLKVGKDYAAVELKADGKQAIEGLLPQRVLSTVMATEVDLVMALTAKGDARRKAKDELKKKYLEEFKKHSNYSRDELAELSRIVRVINSRFCRR